MANQNGRPVAPARKLMAAVLGTIAVFVMLFGLGLSSWSIVALGVALLALAIALAMVNVVRRGARAWVAGTVQVKAVSQPPASSVYGRAELSVVVIAPGLPIQEVTIRDPRVPVEKWPLPGDTLPVNVDVDDMRRVRIDWDEAPSRSDSPDLDPPPASFDIADEDIADDDLLDDVEPPPWATRDRQWGLGPDEPPPPPAPAPRSGDDLDDVVVHDTPAGPIVEGQLVGADDSPPPLPQRARSAPAQGRPAGSRPSPHPRAATAVVDPETETPGPWADTPQPRSSTPEARPAPPQAAAAPAPEQRHPEESQPTGFADDQPTGFADERPAASAAEGPGPEAPSAGAETRAARSHPEPQPVRPYVEPQPEVRPAAAPVPDQPVAAAAAATAAASDASDASTVAETSSHDPEIDLALEGDPEPAPETGPAARTAPASDIIAPPADAAPADTAPVNAAPVNIAPVNAAPVNAAPVSPAAPEPSASAGSAPTTGSAETGVPAGRTGSPWADLEGGFEPDERADDLITAYPSARPGPAAAIHGVGITVLVTNLERSIAFYRDILGFFEIDSSTASAVLASGDTRLVLRTVHDLSPEAARMISLNLEVGDVDAVYQELKAKGVSFTHGPRQVNRGDKLELWAASLSDPDKHNIAITQWRAIR